MRLLRRFVLLLLALTVAGAIYAWPAVTPPFPGDAPINTTKKLFEVRRLPNNPVITATTDPFLREESERYGYVNINGPSLIRVPGWVEKPLGTYYLYFAHHKGESIRLAYADQVEGPWTLHPPGVLSLAESGFTTEKPESAGLFRSALDLWRVSSFTEFAALSQVGMAAAEAHRRRTKQGIHGSDDTRPHIASPDVIVDNERREIRMYFHGLVKRHLQMTRVAVSKDGMAFTAQPQLITAPYLRVVRRGGVHYGLAMPGLLYRSENGLEGFEVRHRPLFAATTRHAAVWWNGEDLYVFFTRVGDAPERIVCSKVHTSSPDWTRWAPTPPVEVLRPEKPWEGVKQPVEPSVRGESPLPVRQLRDPAVFEDEGRLYLLYSVAGEQGIAIAELLPLEGSGR